MTRPTQTQYSPSELREAASSMGEDDNLYVRDLLMWAADKIEGDDETLNWLVNAMQHDMAAHNRGVFKISSVGEVPPSSNRGGMRPEEYLHHETFGSVWGESDTENQD